MNESMHSSLEWWIWRQWMKRVGDGTNEVNECDEMNERKNDGMNEMNHEINNEMNNWMSNEMNNEMDE